MLNRKEMPQQAFSGGEKKKEWKNIMPVGSLLVHHAEGHLLMFFLKPLPMKMNLLRHHHQVDHNKKQTTLLDYNKYKTSEDILDQMLSYYSFERKLIKWWKKLFLHLYYLAVVSAHILHTKTNKKDFTGNFVQKKLPKDC